MLKFQPSKSASILYRTLLSAIAVCAALVVIGDISQTPALANGKQVHSRDVAGNKVRVRGLISRASVVVNKSQILDFHEPYDSALIAQNEIADVVPLSDQSLYVLGKKLGSTRLVVLNAEKQVLRIVEIQVTHDLGELREKLSDNLDASELRVSSANGGILLSGVVRDSTEVEKAVAIAKRYAPDAVTNALSVTAPQQVMLEVRFVEASRTAARELGFGTRTRGRNYNSDSGGQAFKVSDAGALITSAIVSGAEPFGTLIARVLQGKTSVDLIIRALEERNLARRLAEPNLTTMSGDTASFLAGGEFPFPVSADRDKIGIEFKQFGVALGFTPTVLAEGMINLKIAPEVSEIDPTTTVEVNNIRIPGLVVRRADTTVELKDGQSLAIAGLLQHTHVKRHEQLPWLGQVPILGTLFRSAEYQRQETDLVIIVTPRLVKPILAGEKLATPLDNTVPTNDAEFFKTGRSELPAHKTPRRRHERIYGHIIHLPQEVAHARTK